MGDHPDIPEEAVEERVAFALWLSDSGGPASAYDLHREADDAVHRRFLGLARTAIEGIAPALRKQGAEEERERLREVLLGERAVTAATAKIESGEEAISKALFGARPGEPVGTIDRKAQAREALVAAINAALDTPAPSEPEEG
jgi:hypothetical protein